MAASGYHVFDILWLDGRAVTVAAARRSTRAAAGTAIRGAAAPRRAARRRDTVGARQSRRLGRRDRQTARIAVRASPLEALAEDEVRGVAGAGRRRVYRSAGRARRPWRAARRLLRGRAISSSPARSAPDSTPSCCSICAARLDAIELPTSPFTKATGLPRLRAHWVRPEIVVQVAFIEWTVHGKLRHPRLLGVRFDKNARERHDESSGDHASREGPLPGRRDHQRRAGGVLRSAGAAHRCRTCAAGR